MNAEAVKEEAVAEEAIAEEAVAEEAVEEEATPEEETAAQEKAAASSNGHIPNPPARLKQRYVAEVRPQLLKDLGLSNIMTVPTLEKIVLNMGVGQATQQAKLLEGAQADMERISGQRPIVTKAKKSISNFRLREGNPIGVKATLRGERMWEFFDRLVNFAIPRIRDFRGLPLKSFDGHGNYTFGITEQLIFPEISYDDIDTVRGMDITIVTTAHSDEHGQALLSAFGFPFKPDN